MRKKQIIICDSNVTYAERLQEYMSEEKGIPYTVEFYTDWDKCREYLSYCTAEICVLSEDLVMRQTAMRWAVLCESPEQAEEHGIFRYQRADILLRQICELAGLYEPSRQSGGNGSKTKLIGIYTPVGRCLQTSFALVLGQMLASKYKVLYLNFEAYSGFAQMMQRSFNADMADLLFYLKNLSKDFSQQFTATKQTINGLDYIPPAFSYMDISRILPNEWEDFLNALGEMGEYEYLILDLTSYVQGLYQLLRNCAYVYTITKKEGRAQAKIAQYEMVLKELSYEDVLEKTRKCSFPIYRNLPLTPEELLYSELAEYTRKILKEDFHFS